MLLWKGVVCESKKSKFIKVEEVKGLLSSLGIKTPQSLFYSYFILKV